MDPPHRQTATNLNRAFASGALTAVQIARDFLDRIREVDPKVKAFLYLDENDFLTQAEALDRKRARGESTGPLAGVPVALKDNISQRGVPVTCGSRILEPYIAPYDAHVVEAMQGADALCLGRTNMDEFGMGSSTETSARFPTRNPWDLGRVPGGSSGGSAAAVAARMVPLALGSDTGGSVRQPAAFCGIFGLKPTYGRVSRYGLVSYGSSLDQIGPLARNPEDLARLLGVIAGQDRRDSTASSRPVQDYAAATGGDIQGLKLGRVGAWFGQGVESEVRACVNQGIRDLERLGATVREIHLPHARHSIPAYYLIAASEASSNLARFDGVRYGRRTPCPDSLRDLYCMSRGEGFGPEVVKRIVLGTFALSAGYQEAYYRKAQQVRTLIRREIEAALREVDVLVCPTSPVAAFALDTFIQDPLALYLNDVLTVTANLAGIPGLSLPCGFTSGGLPVGLQVMGRPYEESVLLRLAGAHARATDHHRKAPSP